LDDDFKLSIKEQDRKRKMGKFWQYLDIFQTLKSLLKVLKSLCRHWFHKLCAEWSLSSGLGFCSIILGIALFQILKMIWKKQSKLKNSVVSLVPWRHTI